MGFRASPHIQSLGLSSWGMSLVLSLYSLGLAGCQDSFKSKSVSVQSTFQMAEQNQWLPVLNVLFNAAINE